MLLDKINIPADLKQLTLVELAKLSEELKVFIRSTTKTKEGHINASLGVTELSVALHYVLNTPKDILVWDVGHQAYVHKVLTGRKSIFHTNRQKGGVSGFTKIAESKYDAFGTGHSSTSISAVAGFAETDLLSNTERNRVAVIGDGAITGGMSFEALNYIGERKLDVLVILNDNNQSIDDNKGALQALQSYPQFFDSLGFDFLGDCDGSNVAQLVEVLHNSVEKKGPRCLRVLTSKKFEKQEDKKKSIAIQHSFQSVVGSALEDLAAKEEKLVLISPAMLSGGGFTAFQNKFPKRTFDVGIAEQHAVTMAAGMAAAGSIPVVHLYSTFAQRGYDQIIHDVALQKLHMIFCLDRAGLVGEDGPTHHGTFDVGFLNTIPEVKILAPRNGNELEQMLAHSVQNRGTWFIRYPKGNTSYSADEVEGFSLKPKVLKEGSKKLVISFGAIGDEVEEAVAGTEFTHVDLRQLKPFPKEYLKDLLSAYEAVITVEENSPRGGLGDTLNSFLQENKLNIRARNISLPDQFVEHGSRTELLQDCGLDKESLKKAFLLA